MIFIKKFQILEIFFFYFILFDLIFLCYYCCSINLKSQSEHSGLGPNTSSLVDIKNKFLPRKAKLIPLFYNFGSARNFPYESHR